MLPESPRFLYSKRRFLELEESFQVITKMNKVNNPELIPDMIEALKS
jgi:hypothetical protein